MIKNLMLTKENKTFKTNRHKINICAVCNQNLYKKCSLIDLFTFLYNHKILMDRRIKLKEIL